MCVCEREGEKEREGKQERKNLSDFLVFPKMLRGKNSMNFDPVLIQRVGRKLCPILCRQQSSLPKKFYFITGVAQVQLVPCSFIFFVL